MASRFVALLAELKRRKVFGVATAYVVVGAVVAGVANDVLPNLGLPTWTVTFVDVLLLLGLPVALVFAWAFEVRPEEPIRAGSSLTLPHGSAAEAAEESIVVLPFDNFSADPTDAYLADGVTEEITAALSGLHALRVISRTSATHYKVANADIQSIGRELSVHYVLEGSVRKAGDELRITCQLIDATGDSHLWAKKYVGTTDDIFDLQERVARSIVEALALKVTPAEEHALSQRPIKDLLAYESYLRARQGIQTFTKTGLESAEQHLKRALQITGENALIFGQLAQLHYQYWNVGVRLDEKDLRLAREFAERALALDPSSADHHLTRGLLEVTGGNAVRALDYMQAALDLAPSHPDSLAWYPAIAVFLGLEREANAKLELLRSVDPLHPFSSTMPIFLLLFNGRAAAGLELAERERSLRPPEMMFETAYGVALAFNGERTAAAEIFRDTHRPEDGCFAREMLALACALDEDTEGARRLLDSDLQRWAEKDFQYSLFLADIFALIGDSERALDWLEIAVKRGEINYPHLSEFDPFLSALRSHPRFEQLMEKVRAEWTRHVS